MDAPIATDSRRAPNRIRLWALLACAAGASLGGCVSDQNGQYVASVPVDMKERECLLRAMYFESNRSSHDGMMAVGTVVMNRKESGRYPNTVCGVVGQRNQFAPGALTRRLSSRESALAGQAADEIMAGKRLPNMDYVMFFHTAGLHFPYSNMHYRLVAGGNAFYERYPRIPQQQDTQVATDATQQPTPVAAVAQAAPVPAQPQIAAATPSPAPASSTTVVASPQTQTTLAYAVTPSTQPDPESPLFKLLTSADQQRASSSTTPATAVASATVPPTAPAEPAANPQYITDTAAPVPR